MVLFFSCFDQGQVGKNAEEQICDVSTSILKLSARGLLGERVPILYMFFFFPNSMSSGLA